MKKTSVVFLLPIALLLSVVVGCGPSLTPVKGKVSLDGAPLDTGFVAFHPAGATQQLEADIGRSEIGKDGTYSLSTDGAPGAKAGKYKVVVTAGKPSDPADPYSVPISLVDKKFTEVATTPLEVQVPGGNFDLTVTK